MAEYIGCFMFRTVVAFVVFLLFHFCLTPMAESIVIECNAQGEKCFKSFRVYMSSQKYGTIICVVPHFPITGVVPIVRKKCDFFSHF